jgi:hypothetical protein
VQEHGGETIIPFSCILERTLADMLPDEAAKYCEENKLQRLVLRSQWLVNISELFFFSFEDLYINLREKTVVCSQNLMIIPHPPPQLIFCWKKFLEFAM